ncbi:MAG: NTP transferase domain-containing protein [Candidatus Gracilibacteria bacterium]|nr:NTP transferase domain-containing protein [bacterium]MDZ4216687.1 NTP transferase domain-containing protein [Candidatus Gracilibacteria bacterium]
MKTILLAAGQSKRVKPIADKNFVRVCGKFLIEWQLDALKSGGFTDIVMVGNGANLERLSQLRVEGLELRVVEQEDLDGGMKAAMEAAKEFVFTEDEIMVVSSNDVVEASAWLLVAAWLKSNSQADGAMVGYKVSRYFPGGYLKVGEDGFVKTIVEKPGEGNEPSDLVNLVIHVHRDVQGLYAALESAQSDTDDLYETALQQLFDEQKKYSVIPYDGFWQAVKYPWHLLRLTEFFLGQLERSLSPEAQIAETAVINGNVVIEAGVRVFDQVVINGPAYIGRDSIVGNFSLVRGSSLGERCVVGSFTEIARSLLQDEVWTHKNYLGDSVIGSNVSFGSGTVTGNLRLDEGEISVEIQGEKINTRLNKLGLITGDDIRVGINTSFMPGIKVGSNTMIGAELSVGQDIAENTFVKAGGGGLDMRENQKKVERRV